MDGVHAGCMFLQLTIQKFMIPILDKMKPKL